MEYRKMLPVRQRGQRWWRISATVDSFEAVLIVISSTSAELNF